MGKEWRDGLHFPATLPINQDGASKRCPPPGCDERRSSNVRKHVRCRFCYCPASDANSAAAGCRRVEAGAFDPRSLVLLEREGAWAPRSEGGGGSSLEKAPGKWFPPPDVAYEQANPHEVRITARTPPGFVLVLNQFDPAWRVDGGTPLLRANFRYWAIPTPGGKSEFTVRFQPRWRTPALLLGALGTLLTGALLLRPARPVPPLLDNPSSKALASAD